MADSIRKAAKLGGVALLSAAAASATAFVTTRILMKTALDREMPKALEKAGEQIAGTAADQEFMRSVDEAAEKLLSVPMETVTIHASDGTELVGHWYENPDPKRVIIAMHGWRSSWNHDFGTVCSYWHEHGCSVLYAEQRGQSTSGGEYMGFGPIERFDCLDWANWISEKTEEKLPVYLAGVSMGAATVLMAAGLPLPNTVHGIIADCGFTSPDAIWRHVANDNLHIPYRIQGLIIDETYKRLTSYEATTSTVDAMKATKIPVLFVHGSDDHFVPVEMAYENYKACRAPKRLLIVPGADHGMSYYMEPKRYEEAVHSFFADFDDYDPSSANGAEKKDESDS